MSEDLAKERPVQKIDKEGIKAPDREQRPSHEQAQLPTSSEALELRQRRIGEAKEIEKIRGIIVSSTQEGVESGAETLSPVSIDKEPKRSRFGILSRPIPLPRIIIEGVFSDYIKAFPDQLGGISSYPSVEYEMGLPWHLESERINRGIENIVKREGGNNLREKYPQFNEFVTQEMSEIAASKREPFGPLLKLVCMLTGRGSHKADILALSKWDRVKERLDRSFGKSERIRLIADAFFGREEELSKLEEKCTEAGVPLEEMYREAEKVSLYSLQLKLWSKFPSKLRSFFIKTLPLASWASLEKIVDIWPLSVVGIIDFFAISHGIRLAILGHSTQEISQQILGKIIPVGMLTLAISVGVIYHELGHSLSANVRKMKAKLS